MRSSGAIQDKFKPKYMVNYYYSEQAENQAENNDRKHLFRHFYNSRQARSFLFGFCVFLLVIVFISVEYAASLYILSAMLSRVGDAFSDVKFAVSDIL